jgi:tetratricopeptide (TPR) repeat protein
MQDSASGAGEARSRLFWTFSQFLATLTGPRPLLLVLEDLQWADESSLDLLHFVVRQLADKRVLVVVSYCEAESKAGALLQQVSELVERTRLAQRIRLNPLSRSDTEELVTRLFNVPAPVVHGFSRRLFEWTQGNSFFLEGALRALIDAGHLRRTGGRWLGWEVQELELPSSIRDAILMRVGRLSPEARGVADLAAVLGGQVTYGALRATHTEPEESLVPALQELTTSDLLLEAEVGGEVVYGFSHPLIPQTLEARLPLAVTRDLHARVAATLEAHYGAKAEEHVDELAYHFARAHGDTDPGKAVHHLTAAGQRALERNAYREAARYLEVALDRHRKLLEPPTKDPEVSPAVELSDVLSGLARARAGVGDHDGAIELWRELLQSARETGAGPTVANLLRRIGQSHLSQGRLEAALRAFHEGIGAAQSSGDRIGEARLRLVEGVSLQQSGRSLEARVSVDEAMGIAEELGSRELLAKTTQGLLLIHLWNGDLELVRERGMEARAMAADIADPQITFWLEWILATTAGLRGNTPELLRRVRELERIADRARSPRLGLWATELALEHAYATGDWDLGVGIGEQAASLGRALNERTIFPRILVSLSLIYMGRGEMERAGELVEEAWGISGAEGVQAGVEFLNVHTVLPAHIGKAAYLLVLGEWDRAIEVAEAGLEVADRTRYPVWGIHRVLPLLCEGYLMSGRIAEAETLGRRLRAYGEDLDHDLARVWAGAVEAVVAWRKGDIQTGAHLLREAAEGLGRIPLVFDAARLRRQLAGRLWELGDRAGAITELRRVQDVFQALGAKVELEKTIIQFREVGAEPNPPPS